MEGRYIINIGPGSLLYRNNVGIPMVMKKMAISNAY